MKNEHILIEFDALMDTALSTVELFIQEYGDSKYIKDTIRLTNENGLKNLLAFREKANPLSVVLKSDMSTEDMDSLYNEFIDKYYDKILLNTEVSAMGIVASTILRKMPEVKITTYVTKPHQRELIHHYDDQMLIADYTDKCTLKERQDETGRIETYYDTIDLTDYTSIFMYNPIESFKLYSNFVGKNVYVARLMFNLKEILGIFVLDPFITDTIGRAANRLAIMDYYRNLVPIGIKKSEENTQEEKE